MNMTRRDLSLLLPALAAVQARAQEKTGEAVPQLVSTVYHSGQIPYKGDAKKKARRFFYGHEHSGFKLELHETVLGVGMESHPPHKHVHDELMIVMEGTVKTYQGGKTDLAEAGSVIFMQSNQMHGVKNGGETTCRYYVIELRGTDA
jgi:quercetin dioxygenase-like cupin family protein